MSQPLFSSVAALLDDGAAPGGSVTLSESDNSFETFCHGRYAGPGSPVIIPDTVYDVASLTKLFTAALIVRLHAAGNLSVYDRCSVYLPNFRSSEISIIDLLTHRLDARLAMASYARTFPDTPQFRQALLNRTMPAKPAHEVSYANLEFFYLGTITEYITGRSLADNVSDLIMELKLPFTYIASDLTGNHVLAPPTEAVEGVIIQNITHDESARALGGLAGHAGLFSSSRDLAAFGRAWLDGVIVSRDLLGTLVYKDYDPAGRLPQALGWWLRVMTPDGTVIPTPGVYSHTGFTGPFLVICPATGRSAALTCNRTWYGRDNSGQRAIWQLLVDWVSR